MADDNKKHPGEPGSTHPLDTLLRVLSRESFEDDGGAREDQWARKVRRDVDAKLAAMRRQLRPAGPRERQATRISAELLALDRSALLSRLESLQKRPGVRIAHLELSGLTTEDLRLLVAELEATAQTQELPS